VNILLTTDAVGGIWRYAVELSRGLAEHGYSITLAIVGPPASPSQLAELHPCVRPLQTSLPLDWLAGHPTDLDYASTILAGIEADVALLHAPALLRHRWPIPVAVMAHSCLATWFEAVRAGPVPPDYAWRAEASTAGFHRADAVAAPTKAFAAAIRRIHGLRDVSVVHNGRTPLATASAKRDRAVLTAGRLWDDGKDAAVLDRIAPRLSAPIRAAGPVAGPGTQIHLPNLALLGALGETALATAYASATVFASPARYEPFGLAVLEAAQAGMALVLSDIPTFRELWDGVARFVPPDDDDAWLAALEAALDDPAQTAQARATRYTADAMVQGTAALLARIAA
jgi:glycosyltransferase involved in cell wall biosynthesis